MGQCFSDDGENQMFICKYLPDLTCKEVLIKYNFPEKPTG